MSYYGYDPYVSVAEKRRKADKAMEKLGKKDKELSPVIIEGSKLAVTWWGKAWNENLESYADYKNRIGCGHSYVRNHMVLDLKIGEGIVNALVQGSGSKPYKVEVQIGALKKEQWTQILALCNRRISSLEQLIEGKFPRELAVIFTEPKYGFFPSPKEIRFFCYCPDYAGLCKHVAAVLYGVGAKLDQDPLLFFKLRSVDCQELIAKSVESKLDSMLKNAGVRSGRTIAEEDVGNVFGI